MTESRTLNCKNLSCFSHDLPAHRIFKDTEIESYRFLFSVFTFFPIWGRFSLCKRGMDGITNMPVPRKRKTWTHPINAQKNLQENIQKLQLQILQHRIGHKVQHVFQTLNSTTLYTTLVRRITFCSCSQLALAMIQLLLCT